MNIIEISHDYPPFLWGGVGTFVQSLADELSRLGMNIHVLCGAASGRVSTCSEGGLTVTRIPLPNYPPRNLWFQIKSLPLIRRYLLDADVVHGHSTSSTLIALANRTLGRPWIVTVHGLLMRVFPLYFSRPIRHRALGEDLIYTIGFPYSEALHRVDLKVASQVVFVSGHMLRDACGLYGHHLAAKSCAIWAPASRQAFIHKRSHTGQRFTFAYVGRFYWSKGVMLLVDAFSRLAKKNRNRDVALRLYGRGPLERAIRNRIVKIGLHVELRGWTEHSKLLSELSSDVDAVILPSLYEACPVAILEAMSLGIPVIVSNSPWSLEFVKDRVTGLRSRLDESSLCEQMEILLQNEELRLLLGKNARAYAELNFHPTRIARAYADLFSKASNL